MPKYRIGKAKAYFFATASQLIRDEAEPSAPDPQLFPNGLAPPTSLNPVVVMFVGNCTIESKAPDAHGVNGKGC